MAAPDWAPRQSDVEEQHAGNGGVNGSAADTPQEYIDLDDPRLTSEKIDVNLEGSVYKMPAPPPDGRYRVKLKLARPRRDNKEVDYYAAQWGKEQQLVIVTGIEATVMDPTGKYDGVKAFDRTVSTYTQARSAGASKATEILALLRRPDGTPWLKSGQSYAKREIIDTLLKALAGEPEIGMQSCWSWSCQQCGEEAEKAGERRPRDVRGMRHFPQIAQNGKLVHDPEMACKNGHGTSRARFDIEFFFPLAELKA